MHILVIGSGGREHALCWKIRQSPMVDKLYCAPGNGGIAREAVCVPLNVMDFDSVLKFCREKEIGLVVVGPEGPLVAGITDFLEPHGITVFGPHRMAAQLEGSKGFTKDLCERYSIPTAAYARFYDAVSARKYIEHHPLPVVVKADGLAAGKGVVIATSHAEAMQAVDDMFAGTLAGAQSSVVIEEFMEGEEVSFFALTDGDYVLSIGSAQDHKRVGNGDTGPNTGGMGAYSPAPIMDESLRARVLREIILPTVDAMAREGIPFKGVLFAGLMITKDGPKLVEYNARFGDPETEVILPRLEQDLVPLMLACAQGTLHEQPPVRLAPFAALTVVMAARGYPGNYEKGTEIKHLEVAELKPDVTVFHAGTKTEGPRLIAQGGRVLCVTALGVDVRDAQLKAYDAISGIEWHEGFYRTDIGWRAVERAKQVAFA